MCFNVFRRFFYLEMVVFVQRRFQTKFPETRVDDEPAREPVVMFAAWFPSEVSCMTAALL